MASVYIGVGHGGSDSGAVANSLIEKSMNLVIAIKTYEELRRHNVSCMISRMSDETEDLYAKINECNKYNPTLAVDIHNNAGGGNGFEAYYHYNGGSSLSMAKNIEREVVAIGQNSRGCKIRKNEQGKDYYAFIRETKCASTIVECAFIDSDDRFIIDEIEEQQAFGIAIARGILETLGIPYKEEVKEPSKPTSSSLLYRVVTGSYKEYDNAKNRVKALKEKGFEAFIDVVKK